jgi:hypothetical protein
MVKVVELTSGDAGCAHGPWRISRSPALSYALPNAHFNTFGLDFSGHTTGFKLNFRCVDLRLVFLRMGRIA